MVRDIEERVARAVQACRASEILQQHADDLRRRARLLETRLPELADRHAAEQRDVDRLESVSLTRIIVALRGSRTDVLARERAEAERARYRLADVQAQLAAVRGELATVRAELSGVAEVRAEFAAALAAKEEYLRDSGDARFRPLLVLAEERGHLRGEQREIDEAERAAALAADALGAVQSILSSADGWSTYDTFFGGGALSSSIKHARLDEAARAAAYADRCLAVLRTELADVDGVTPTARHVAVDGMTQFVDVWFDNVFTDFAVHDRIRRAQHNVSSAQGRVAAVRARLAERSRQAQRRLAEIDDERRALLVA